MLLAVLDAADFPGRDKLRTQVPFTSVVGYCDCGCATVDLAVDPAAEPASEDLRPVPPIPEMPPVERLRFDS